MFSQAPMATQTPPTTPRDGGGGSRPPRPSMTVYGGGTPPRPPRRRRRWVRIALWSFGTVFVLILVAAAALFYTFYGDYSKITTPAAGIPERGEEHRPAAARGERPGDRARDRLRPPLHGRLGARALRHPHARADRPAHAPDLAALAAARPVGRHPRLRPGQDQRRLLGRRPQDGGRDREAADRPEGELPDRGELPQLHEPRERHGRRLSPGRPGLRPHPGRERGAAGGRALVGDQRPARLPAPDRQERARLLALPPHRLRLLPQRPPADVPARLRAEGLPALPRDQPERPRRDPRHHPHDRVQRRHRRRVGRDRPAHDAEVRDAGLLEQAHHRLPPPGDDRHDRRRVRGGGDAGGDPPGGLRLHSTRRTSPRRRTSSRARRRSRRRRSTGGRPRWIRRPCRSRP